MTVMTDLKPEDFWGWCQCDCLDCVEIGDHGKCPDTVNCGMPKTYDPNEQRRERR